MSAFLIFHYHYSNLLGKWWVVGSAWAGRGPNRNEKGEKGDTQNIMVDASAALLEKAKKLRMNTELRKNIFCILMTSEVRMVSFSVF